MSRLNRNDIVLLVGVAVALVVTFEGPIQRLVQLGRSFEDRFGLALLPGVGVLLLTFVGHRLMLRAQAASRARRESQAARLVGLGRSLASLATVDEIRSRLAAASPEALHTRGLWVLLRGSESWEAILGGSVLHPDRATPDTVARAERVLALESSELDVVRGTRIDGHLCFKLQVGEHGVGVLGAPITEGSDIDLGWRLAYASTVIAVALHNVALRAEVDEHGVVDGLTGCLTRSHGLKVLDAELQRAMRAQTSVTLLMLDLDFFKSVNDDHGHLCGDALLTAIGKRMHEQLRTSDVKIRYGGEEFLVLLPDTEAPGGQHVADVLNRELGRVVVPWEGSEVSTSVSVGVAAARRGELDAHALIGRADAALYLAKRDGRDRVSVDPLTAQREPQPAPSSEPATPPRPSGDPVRKPSFLR